MAVSTGSASLSQLSSGHAVLYENYWRQADVGGSGKVGASEAAAFLKKSNLSEAVLHEIWKLANPLGKAYLDKQGFYVSLRLIANAQNGKEVSLHDITSPGPAPKLGDLPISSVLPPPPNDGSGWLIQGPEKSKYDGVFESLNPVNGLLSGDKVKPILLNSKLHVDVLGRVWDLSDVDKDGMLDKDEFTVAMYLVYKALDGEPVPNVLPPRLVPPSKRQLVRGSPSLSPGVSPTPKVVSTAVTHGSTDIPWVVAAAEKSKYDAMFKTADKDNDNLVTGDEIKNIFMASGLPQTLLAHIWGLCDMNNSGRLNGEQFALAMHLIHQKVKGIEPPQTLPPEMIPPSMRVAGQTLVPATTALDDAKKDMRLGSMAGELDKITKEIEELGKTKTTLQKDIEETEDLIRHRNIEVQDLESELEKAKEEIKDLEKRKNETKSQLDKLDEEKAKYEDLLKEVQTKCQEETQKINSLKSQIADRDSSIQSQEDKLSAARNELNKLRQQETQLEKEVQEEKDKLESVQKQVKSVQTEIAQVKTKLNEVKDQNATLNGEINTYNGLLQTGGNTTSQPNSLGMADFPPISSDGLSDLMTTTSEMDTMSMRATAGSSPVSSISGFSVGSGRVDEAVDDFKDKDGGEDDKEVDPFKPKDDSEPSDPFTTDDPFKSDPFAQFKSVSFADPFSSDPFEEKDPFGPSETKSPGSPFKSDPFTSPVTKETTPTSTSSDPFSSVDPFQSAFSDTKTSSDDFFSGDPFKSTSSHTSLSKSTNSSKDPFQSTDFFGSNDLFDGRAANSSTDGNKTSESDSFSNGKSDPFKPTAKGSDDPFTASFASFPEQSKQKHGKVTKSPERDMIEWAKRQSKKDEKDRQKKIKSLQEEEEKQLALALKKSLEESQA